MTFVAHQLFDRGGDVGVFPFEQLFPALNDRDAAAEAAHRLGKFQADIAAANDDQMLRQSLQFERFDMRQRLGGGQSGHGGNHCPRAEAEETRDRRAIAASRRR